MLLPLNTSHQFEGKGGKAGIWENAKHLFSELFFGVPVSSSVPTCLYRLQGQGNTEERTGLHIQADLRMTPAVQRTSSETTLWPLWALGLSLVKWKKVIFIIWHEITYVKYLKYGRLSKIMSSSLSEFLMPRKPVLESPSLCPCVYGLERAKKSCPPSATFSPSPCAWFGRFIFHRQNIPSPCRAVGHNTFPFLLKKKRHWVHSCWYYTSADFWIKGN